MTDYDKLFSHVEKEFGSNTMGLASESDFAAKPLRIKTDIFDLDLSLGGGIPLGKTIIIEGPPSGGKSLITYKAGAAFQRHCRHCKGRLVDWDEISQTGVVIQCCEHREPNRVVWIDAEKSYDVSWSGKLSVDNSRIHVARPATAEDAINIGTSLIESGELDLLIIDSVANLTPAEEIKGGAKKWQRALHPRLMSKMCHIWRSTSDLLDPQYSPTIILINQVRASLSPWGKKTTSPGGNAIKHAASIILQVKKRGMWTDQLGRPIGQGIEVAVEKNKTCLPGRSAEFSIAFSDCSGFLKLVSSFDEEKKKAVSTGDRKGGSTDLARQIFRYALFWELVVQSGAWFELAGKKFHGETNMLEFLAGKKKLLRMLGDQVWQKEFKYIEQDGKYFAKTRVKQKKVNKPREEAS